MSTRVSTLPPGTYTDPGQPGLQLRVRANSNGTTRSWLLRFKFRGEESRILLGHFPDMALERARKAAQELRERADEGIDPRRAKPRRIPTAATPTLSAAAVDSHSVEHLASDFLERFIKPRRKHQKPVATMLAKDVLPKWKGRDARTITPAEVLEVLDGIVDRGSKVMANRVASVLTQMFRWGIHRRIVESSPVQLLFRPGGQEKPRERALSDAELKALLKEPQKLVRLHRTAHVIQILLLTGQRRGELAAARWRDIDLEARTWRIPDENSKTGRGHVVPLSDWARDEFKALKAEAEQSRYVLPSSPGADEPIDAKQLTRSLAKCRARFKAAKIDAFTLHDLRRTCRTGLAKLKVAPHIAERVLNHAQEKIPGTYDVHDYLEEKREALEKWAAHLQDLRP